MWYGMIVKLLFPSGALHGVQVRGWFGVCLLVAFDTITVFFGRRARSNALDEVCRRGCLPGVALGRRECAPACRIHRPCLLVAGPWGKGSWPDVLHRHRGGVVILKP